MTSGKRHPRWRDRPADAGPSATFPAVTARRFAFALGLLVVAWAFFRPKAIVCPQCKGRGAPPLVVNGEPRARICATCGASATPDLPLVGDQARTPEELREMLGEYVDREGPIE